MSTPSEFGLFWPGKAAARDLARTPPASRLSPGVGLDGDRHLLLVGDNLDGLKLLAPALSGKVRLVYLDPPYNKGRDLAYHDRFAQGRAAYAARCSLPTFEGSSAALGRLHAGWLDMMLPRLLLSHDLLADDGVLLVSLDDGEAPHLRLLCDEVFGPRGFVAQFVWETKRAARGVPPRTRLMATHEYVICYAKDREKISFRGLDRDDADFGNPDGDPRGPWRSESMKATGRRQNVYDLVDPATGRVFRGNWAFSERRMAAMVADGLVLFPSDPAGTPRQKKHRGSHRNAHKGAVTALGWHPTENATRDLMRLFDDQKVFDFPKPLSLMRFFCDQLVRPGDLVLDPFAGSGTTAHAVWAQNAEDGGARRVILIQRPEPCLAGSPAADAGLGTLADVTRARLARAGATLGDPPLDVLTLAPA